MISGACNVQPAQTQPTKTELLPLTLTVSSSTTATPTFIPATTTITSSVPTNTAHPTVDLSVAATQVWATVDDSAILWSGVVDRAVFKQVMTEKADEQSWFSVSTNDTQFELSNKTVLIAAYFYEVTPGGQRHGRFLMYQPVGKLKSVPFLFKFDMPVEWVGEHEEYGNYDSIIADIEWEFREPMIPNFLKMAILSKLNCQGETVPFCEQLKANGVDLPADGHAAEALVMDQIESARKTTSREWRDIAAVVEVAEQGPEWWNDSRIPLLAIPRVTTCIPENRCATFSNMELAIDLVNGGP
jgi:hypothetical protein